MNINYKCTTVVLNIPFEYKCGSTEKLTK